MSPAKTKATGVDAFWTHHPGCVARLATRKGEIVEVIHSPEVGVHHCRFGGTTHANLHDAMRSAEKRYWGNL